MLLHADGSIDSLGPTDIPVGLVDRPGVTFEVAEVSFPPNATLVVVSDGVTEAARTLESPYFGEGPLEAVLRAAPASAQDTCARIRQALEEFLGDAPRTDDATLLVLKRCA
jgi:sigma-B regulation protein RsbU (phosphoserine phosphatase)